MSIVNVKLGARSYQISIGKEQFAACADFLRKSAYTKKAFIVTDTTVASIYLDDFVKHLEDTGFKIETFVLPDGEQAKSFKWAQEVYTKVIEAKLDRKSPIIALGGGVPGDLTGFIAATYMRGVPFIQAPTTLLAQVDSSVGGKVAINHPLGKNLIGAFYQPEGVFIDSSVLKSLSDEDFASGLAEIVKYACLKGEEWLDFLNDNLPKILKRDDGVLQELIAKCCEYKAYIVENDEQESGMRMFLNLGHTYGHAVELEGNFSTYTHGQAVAIGLHGCLLLSEQVFGLSKAKYAAVLRLLKDFSLPTVANNMSREKVYKSLWHDKKTIGDNLQWVLLDSIGNPIVKKDVPLDLVKSVVDKIVID